MDSESEKNISQAIPRPIALSGRRGKTFRGTVVSTKMQESAVVLVMSFVKHARYGKYIRRRKKYLVHDPGNQHKEGESVTIASSRPLSKRKHFIIV